MDNMQDFLKELPKVVLHLHLDGSLRPETVFEWLKEQGQGQDLTLDSVRKALMVEKDCRDLTQYLEKFDLPCRMLQTKEHIEQAVFELLEDLSNQNVKYAEIRFAPSKHREQGLDYNEIVEVAIRGLEKAKEKFDIDGNLILCCMRGDSNQNNIDTIDVAGRYLGQGVAAVDLAGAEASFPTVDYKAIFEYAKEKQIPATIHAGEADGPKSIKDALVMGATRIGHGVRAIEDQKLIRVLKENEIPLEICPTSNLQTNAFENEDQLVNAISYLSCIGIPVTISPDNMTVSSTNILDELRWILEKTRLTTKDLLKIQENAAKSIFATDKQRQHLLGIINDFKTEYLKKMQEVER